jgi:hypothetical protein
MPDREACASAPTLWVLNLDAEYELEDPRGYTPSRAMQRRVDELAAHASRLLRPGDAVLRGGVPVEPAPVGVPYLGMAWCPTPRALAQLASAGATLPVAPSLAVLQRVNHRRFAIELDPGPLQARHFGQIEAIQVALARPSPSGAWLAKRAFGLAGRGHRRIHGPPSEHDLGWLRNGFKHGHGVALEPFVGRLVDVGLHGSLARSGALRVGQPVLQHCDARGAWQASVPLPSDALTAIELAQLECTLRKAAAALHDSGYFGPFGIDAFAYRTHEGRRGFQPLVEINARFSMGWPLCGLPAQHTSPTSG